MKKTILGFTVLMFGLIALPTWATTTDITQINFTTSPQTIDVNVISSTLTTQTQNTSGTEEKLDTSGTILDLSSSSGTGEFSASSATWISVTSLGMNNGWANRNFYYRDSTSGTHTLTITAQNQTWTPATQTITVNAPAITLTSITVTTPPTKTFYTVGESFDIAGLTITGTYSDNSTTSEQVGYPDVVGFDSSVPASGQVLTVTVNGQTATFTVDIIATPTPIEPVVEPNQSSHSSGYLLGWGQVLGASTSREQELAKQRQLRVIERKLRQIKRQLVLIRHPELANLSQIEFATSTVKIEPKTDSSEGDNDTGSVNASTSPKKWWRILW